MRRYAATLFLALAACGGGGGSTVDTRPVIDATTAPAPVTVKVTGALTISFTGQAKVQFIRSVGSKVPENLRLISVAMPEFQRAGPQRFRGGFNVYGYKEGAKAAVVPAADPTPTPGLRSVAYFEVEGTPRFDTALERCAITFTSGRSGRMTCPRLRNASGGVVSFDMAWELP